LRLRLAARLVLRDGTLGCILTDLSLGGARIVPAKPVREGADAVLMWAGGLEAFGRIVWVEGRECGILFDEALAVTAIQATRQVNEVSGLPAERELLRRSAQEFVRSGARL
jgi:hypothetical protein